MFGFRPMETIPESNSNPTSPRRAGMMAPDASLDALLYTLPSAGSERNRPLNLDPSLFRSSSTSKIKKPTQRVRDWMKRSNSTRSAKHQEEDPPYPSTEQHIIKIAHLGGGRVPPPPEFEELLTPAALKPQKSGDSRVTQWIDLYPEALAGLNSPSSTYSPQKEGEDENEDEATRLSGETVARHAPPQQQQQQEPVELPAELEGDVDLRPAPLRTPSNASGGSSVDGNRGGSGRREGEGIKWKPLPELPVQKAMRALDTPPLTPDRVGEEEQEEGVIKIQIEGVERRPREIVVEREVEARREVEKGKEQPSGIVVERGVEQDDVGLIEDHSLEFGHEVERELQRAVERVVRLESEREAENPAVEENVAEVDDAREVGTHDVVHGAVQEEKSERSAVAQGKTRWIAKYTRQERVWLHHNYRGEAPFLLVWGLDIRNEEDREEGLEILRELMQAESETGKRRDVV
ncbi:hypothetical protein OQA88_5597 [Cercophora sp. LCS_1]